MDHSSRESESPLSDIGSDEFTEDKFQRSRSLSNASSMSLASDSSITNSTSTPNLESRPKKRRRVGDYDPATPLSTTIPASPGGSISSDSDGSVPNSPSFANLGPTHPLSTAYAAFQANPHDPESADYTQVTRCAWANCPEPDQGNMDNLVTHINEAHIPPKQKKYFCEWEGCTRSAIPHTSAYALKAHMRSHTKEKPFMCSVPECDRSFTRSDALAKHMRTVHETEALRPSDPVPRGHLGGIAQTEQNGKPKLKLTFKKTEEKGEVKVEGDMPALPTVGTAGEAGVPEGAAILDADEARDETLTRAVDIDSVPFKVPVEESYWPREIWEGMEDYEKALPPSQWFRLLRRQLRWAEEDRVKLERELGEMKAKTDDLAGVEVTKDGKLEEVGDMIRAEEWAVTDNLLDRIADAQIRVLELDAGDGDGMDHDQKKTSWERVLDLPHFRSSAMA